MLLSIVFLFAAAGTGALSIEALLDIRHPSRPAWSPDGTRVAFVWDRGGVQDVYVVSAAGGPPETLTRHADGLIGGLFWSVDGRSVYFERVGDLWQAQSGAEPRAVWTTPEPEGEIVPSPDGSRVAFIRQGDLWVRDLAGNRETRLTATSAAESEPTWAPDGRRIAFTLVTSSPREDVPDYVGFKIAFRGQGDWKTRVGVAAVEGGLVTDVAAGDGTESAPRWLDARRLVLQRESRDLKSREIVLAEPAGAAPRVLHRDVDPRWWSLTYLGAEPVPSPDGRHVAFVSDADGWDHVYVVASGGGPAAQVTRGRFEATGLAWSPDGRRLAFDANDGPNPGRRQLMVAEIGDRPGRSRVTAVTSGPGTHSLAVWSPDGQRLLFQRTGPRDSADLYVVEASPDSAPRRLTDSLPPAVDRARLVEPRFVRYPSKDGQSVPAWLFEPPRPDRQRRHPAIVWVHGDGITQNFEGWHTRRDYAVYYSFHQRLAQRGYVVLAVDYRGSIGYGREWRQGHYRDLGGRDYEDVAAGVDYLRTLGYVDAERVGIWGLSYGGFMALQALTVTPELFRCAIDVAGVEDWRDWYRDPDGPWIRGRMGTPDENPDLYTRTSPIHRVHLIRRPLLVMHGTADVNVPFLESVRLVDAVLKAGKDVEFVVYPGEYHYFHRAHVLRDAWSRVEQFFDRHLRPGP